MKLIVGLGNPGNEYKNNRHNVGFMFIDYMVKWLNGYMVNPSTRLPSGTWSADGNNLAMKQFSNSEFTFDKYLMSDIIILNINNQKTIFAKPQTYMNKSGSAVSRLIGNWKLEIGNLIVIHDDLDIPLGKFRIDFSRGPRLHNGILSIEQLLKTQDFWRVRIGVDNRAGQKIPGETYVLQDFKQSERKIIDQIFPEIFDELKKLSSLRGTK